jgi:Cu(I)/Ag(I) efflux system membrane fusion protein
MKKYITYIGVLAIGLLIGWLVFGNTTSQKESHNHNEETTTEHWTCSMHPQIDFPESGSCPICGMDLILKTNSETGIPINQFKMSKNAMALANIETVIVGNASGISKTLKLSGKISTNDKTGAVQTAHFGGRIEKLNFKTVGEYVSKGALIASIYSPELVTAQNELIEAISIKESQPELYKAVRNKLKYWKISEKQIQDIEYNKTVQSNFNMFANVSGHISEIFIEEGNHVNEGAPLFNVSNLESVWADFDVYEQDIKNLKVGQNITINLIAYPDKIINTKIDYIDPVLNYETRTVKVRATIQNNNNLLKPGLLITSELKMGSNKTQLITIPKSAVMWTGKRSIVYVKVSLKPVFELREIGLGNAIGSNYEVLNGLEIGDEIVSNGTFTVDAAAQLQGKSSMMNHTNNTSDHDNHNTEGGYQCPMDCEHGKIYEKEGSCPVCKMDLIEVNTDK